MYSFNTLELILIWINKKHNVSNNSKLLNNIFYIVLQHDHWDKSKLYIFNGGKLQMIKWSINKHRSCFFNNFFEDFFSLFEKQNALLFLNLIKIIPVYKNNLIYILYNLYNTNTFLRFFSYMCHLKNKGFDVCCRIPSKVLNRYLKYKRLV